MGLTKQQDKKLRLTELKRELENCTDSMTALCIEADIENLEIELGLRIEPKGPVFKGQNIVENIELEQKYKIVCSSRLEEALWFLNNVHKDSTGFISINKRQMLKDGKYKMHQKHYKLNELEGILHKFLHLEDLYISNNSFLNTRRLTAHVRQLNALYVDIDYYKKPKYKDLTPKELIEIMRKDGCFTDLEPSFFVSSGRGLYIYYLLENAPKQVSGLYNKVQIKLSKKFQRYGADPNAKDISRIFRLPGAKHNNQSIVKLIFNGTGDSIYSQVAEPNRYRISTVADILLPQLPYSKEEWEALKEERAIERALKQAQKRTTNITTLKTLKNLNYTRVQDILKLAELRGNVEGCREVMCYMARLFSLYAFDDYLKADETAIQVAKMVGLEENASYVTRSAEASYEQYLKVVDKYSRLQTKPAFTKYLRENGCVIYTNARIIQDLDITPGEMELMETLITPEVKQDRRRIREKENYNPEARKEKYQNNKEVIKEKYQEKLNKAGKVSKKEEVMELRAKIKSLRTKGFKNKEITQFLNIPLKTLERHISFIKKTEGLLP